jgi:hypothetical protein
MGRKKQNREGDETMTAQETTGDQPSAEPVKPPYKSKMNAVRQAMRAKGADAKPGLLAEWLWKKYKLEMTNDSISSYRSTILRKQREEQAEEAGTPLPEKVVKVVVPLGNGLALAKAQFTLEDVRIIRQLVNRVGKAPVHDLIDLLM